MAHRYLSTAETTLTLTKLAAYVAVFLSEGGSGWDGTSQWTYTPPTEDSYSHKLIGPDEAVIYLSLTGDTAGDRVNISGSFHIGKTKFGNSEFVRPKSGTPSDISVALDRGFATVAQEILKRYLPKYLPALAEARTQRDADQAYKVKQQSNLSRLALLAGSRTPDMQSHSVSLSIGEVYGDIEAYGDSITLKFRSLTMAQAETLIKTLRKQA